jgi:hypothetical protein
MIPDPNGRFRHEPPIVFEQQGWQLGPAAYPVPIFWSRYERNFLILAPSKSDFFSILGITLTVYGLFQKLE